MAKVYRLHEGQDGTGWFVTNQITKDQLRTIKTEGKDVASSIPSPFARIDLVKSAFAWVANSGIDGSSAQHKLVSDSLDVAQLFFLYPTHKDNVKIVSWNPKDRFEKLAKDSTIQHSKFAETLDIFWNQDSEVYNFDKVKRLYFLLNNSNQVIGGTSPATLFFASPDVNEYAQNLNIVCNDDFLFDDNYYSLARRDKSFIEYMFTLSLQPNFANWFPEVYSYLEEVKNGLAATLRNKIAGLNPNNIYNYSPCTVLDNLMDPCEILNIPIGVQVTDSKIIEQQSDFVISPELYTDGLKPLILPNDKFAKQLTYTTEGVIWNANNEIPYRNDNSAENSVLPVQGGQYPWLSAGNFLEDKIIELPYTIDSSKFKTCGAKKHLLPLTPTFFKYFKAENVSKYLKLEELAGGGIEARLEIPVKNGMITFKKTYHRDNITEMGIHLAILPFLHVANFDLDYTLGLQDVRLDRTNDILFECFDKNKTINISSPIVRKKGERNTIKSSYYRTKYFDSLSIKCGFVTNFIVPIMEEVEGRQQISYAIDFGTSNTHMEYKFGLNPAKGIDITSDLPMWQSLIDRNEKNDPIHIVDDNNYEREIFPYQFNDNNDFKFPVRTVLTYNQNIDFHKPIEVFTHTNNFLLFEKVIYPRYFNLQTKLKWSNYKNEKDKVLVRSYIEFLIYIALYKTLLLNGDPSISEIIWFYPVSMDSFEQAVFKEEWENAYRKVFKTENIDNIRPIPESIAPYLFYKGGYPGLSLSIDIGGGSSDIAVFKNAKDLPEFISSFRFAGNSIFGDGFPNSSFTNSPENNGFVQSFHEKVSKSIQGSNKNIILEDIIVNRQDSADFSSFLFSLENDKDVKFNYLELLRQDTKLKLPILIFYAAIIYYSANLLKKQGSTDVPKNILFSGTASKTLKIIAPDLGNEHSNISKLFVYIFNQIMQADAENIKIALADNPKEITCKGALKAKVVEDFSDCPIIIWLGGMGNSSWGESIDKRKNIQQFPTYSDLNINENKSLIESSINHFFSLLDGYFKSINLEGEFMIDNIAYTQFKKMRSLNVTDFIEQGIVAFNKLPDAKIEETLFFYPLIGIINKLSFELANTE